MDTQVLVKQLSFSDY